MSAVVLDDTGHRALIYDRETGDVRTCSVPTALENVANGQGRWVHGASGDRIRKGAATPAPEPEVAIQLVEPDLLVLPPPEGDAPVDPEQATRNRDIAAALGLLNEFDYVATGERKGKPKCSAVENLVGYPVGKDEVDAIWDAK